MAGTSSDICVSNVLKCHYRKVMIILEELGLEYETIFFDTMSGDQKKEPHIKYNPNGRIPTLIDHSNNDFVVW